MLACSSPDLQLKCVTSVDALSAGCALIKTSVPELFSVLGITCAGTVLIASTAGVAALSAAFVSFLFLPLASLLV